MTLERFSTMYFVESVGISSSPGLRRSPGEGFAVSTATRHAIAPAPGKTKESAMALALNIK
jgi:hypothetical protein